MFTSFTVALSKLWKWEILTTHQMLQLKWIPVCLERFWTRLWLLYFVFKILQANHVLSHIWKLKLDRNKQQRRSSIWPQLAFSHWKWIFIFCLSVTLKKIQSHLSLLDWKKTISEPGQWTTTGSDSGSRTFHLFSWLCCWSRCNFKHIFKIICASCLTPKKS